MKNFYMKHKDSLIIMVNVIIIVLGFFTKNTMFSIIGLILLFVSIYLFALEKQNEEKRAQIKAEMKALRAEQKRLNKGKKKKKNKKKRK